jgi:hypothetical protein
VNQNPAILETKEKLWLRDVLSKGTKAPKIQIDRPKKFLTWQLRMAEEELHR